MQDLPTSSTETPMRDVPFVDQECTEMFALDAEDSLRANSVLCALGRDSMDSVAEMASALPERCFDAVLWRALAFHAPWPWLGAELASAVERKCEQRDGRKLFCALIARQSAPGSDLALAPAGLDSALATLGAIGAPTMASPSDMAILSPRRRLALARSMESGPFAGLPVRTDEPALGAWILPVLYTPSRHGDYLEMDDRTRGLLCASLADATRAQLAINRAAADADPATSRPRDLLLGFGPLSSILASAAELCAPLSLSAKIHALCDTLMAKPADIACSVSFHHDGGSKWMRVALRPNLTGFCLAGLDWPCAVHGRDHAFDRLLDTLSEIGVEWCHQVEGEFDALACPECQEPIYPTPSHAPWRDAFLEMGSPPDGSHLHD